MSIRHGLSAAAIALACSLAAAGAIAAPQVLGIVASNGNATPLQCVGGECSAHFSSFCLQQNRPAPSGGQPYDVAPGGSLTIVATAADGSTVRLPGETLLSITSLIGFTSVKIGLPQDKLAALGAVTVAVEVGDAVSVIPRAGDNDSAPQTIDEIALATGAMRLAAQRSFEAPSATGDAARITSLLINSLPAKGVEPEALRDGLWLAKAGDAAVKAATPAGLELAKGMYENCLISVDSRSSYSMRNCLEMRHADLQALTNHRFWHETAGY